MPFGLRACFNFPIAQLQVLYNHLSDAILLLIVQRPPHASKRP
jgi:hypothetical protein